MIDKKLVYKELDKVVDPEVNIPITEMELVGKVEIHGDEVNVEFHFTTPLCPPAFALKIGQDVKHLVGKVPEVKKVKVKINNHFLADQINQELEKDAQV